MPKQLVTSIKKISWAIPPCHVDNSPVGCIFHSFAKTLAACCHQGSLAMLLMSMTCVWYVWPKAQCFDGYFPQKFDRFPAIQTPCFLKFKIFVCSPRKLWFHKSWDHIAQRGPWDCLSSYSWLSIFISWSHLCLYPHIYVGAASLLCQKVFKDLPCLFPWSPHSPIACSTSALGYFLRAASEKFLSCHITRQNLQGWQNPGPSALQ